jgi:hypothetical protein
MVVFMGLHTNLYRLAGHIVTTIFFGWTSIATPANNQVITIPGAKKKDKSKQFQNNMVYDMCTMFE